MFSKASSQREIDIDGMKRAAREQRHNLGKNQRNREDADNESSVEEGQNGAPEVDGDSNEDAEREREDEARAAQCKKGKVRESQGCAVAKGEGGEIGKVENGNGEGSLFAGCEGEKMC